MVDLHLFEFMDLHWLPASLQATTREILECGNARPFRGYYDWVARQVEKLARENGLTQIVELGAGTAPITRTMAADSSLNNVTLVPCDIQPNVRTFRDLQAKYPVNVKPNYAPVDFSRAQKWSKDSVVVLSGTLHHLSPASRRKAVIQLSKAAGQVVVCEPLRRTWPSFFFVFLSIFAALILPLRYANRPGRVRRIVWCWLCPVAPLAFVWDGVVSCLRMWDERQWRRHLAPILTRENLPQVKETTFCQWVSWGTRKEKEKVEPIRWGSGTNSLKA